MQTQFLCCFKSTMATDQNIKNKTLASEIDTAYGRYCTWYVHSLLVCKMYKEAITGEFVCSWQNLLWTTKTWRYSVLSFMKIEKCWYLLYFSWLCNTQSFSNSLKALLTVSVIIFPDIIFWFAVQCLMSVRVSSREKSKDSNSEESIDFSRVRTEW